MAIEQHGVGGLSVQARTHLKPGRVKRQGKKPKDRGLRKGKR